FLYVFLQEFIATPNTRFANPRVILLNHPSGCRQFNKEPTAEIALRPRSTLGHHPPLRPQTETLPEILASSCLSFAKRQTRDPWSGFSALERACGSPPILRMTAARDFFFKGQKLQR